ncbi:hypothetical protein GVN24_29225 [Rhizobium sp. CRIBSB]|nr:hypothetical protein [Rhizobium sp. CRIBSB]
MFRRIAATVILSVLALAGNAAAQTVDLTSTANRVWWNGVTPQELQELATEAGATFSDLPDEADIVVSQITFPGLAFPVTFRQGDCLPLERPLATRNCGAMVMMITDIEAPSDVELYRSVESAWLTTSFTDGVGTMHRYEIFKYGTTRGYVLAAMLLFRGDAIANLDLMDEIDAEYEDGW